MHEALTFDWTINVGNIITVLCTLIGFGIGAIGLYYGLKGNQEKLSLHLTFVSGRLINVENAVQQFSTTLSEVAVQDSRIDDLTRRVDEMQRSANEAREWARAQITDIWKAQHDSRNKS